MPWTKDDIRIFEGMERVRCCKDICYDCNYSDPERNERDARWYHESDRKTIVRCAAAAIRERAYQLQKEQRDA